MTGQDHATGLVERYGAPSTSKRRAIVLASVVLAVAFLGWLGWAIWGNATPQVTSNLDSFNVVDDHTTTAVLTVTVHKSGAQVSCTVQALAEDHSVVGEVTPHPSASGAQDLTIRTDRRATSVQSLGCTTPSQHHPR